MPKRSKHKDTCEHRYTVFLSNGSVIRADEYGHSTTKKEYTFILCEADERTKNTIPEGSVMRIEEKLID